MRTHITNLYGQAPQSTALIAQNMVADVAKTLGFNEIGIYSYPVHTDTDSEVRKRIDGMIAGVGADDLVVAQFPSWNSIEFDDLLVNKLLSYSEVKVAIFIHDVIPLMFENNYYLMGKFIALCNKSEVIIVPTEKMLNRLRKEGLTVSKVVIQNLWDHTTAIQYKQPKFSKLINFAGAVTRFPFVKDWHYQTPLRVFSNIDEPVTAQNVEFSGWIPDDEMMLQLSQGFGLVWSEQIENQNEREYSTYNLSYKLSTYLAAGIPLIVNRGISTQKFIEDNHLGFVVDSLSEASEIVQNMTEKEYADLATNVKQVSYLIRNGYFTKKLLIDTVHAAFTK